jgi:hypothetical protein
MEQALQQKLTALAESITWNAKTAPTLVSFVRGRTLMLPPVRQYSLVCENHLDRPFLGDRGCDCGGAGAPCPNCNKTNPADPDEVPQCRAASSPI